MPHIFDNIELSLLKTLKETLRSAVKADFCVGYFNLRGWGKIDQDVEQLPGSCRLMVGIQRLPEEELRRSLAIGSAPKRIDRQESMRLQKLMAQKFREQLTVGAPTDADEQGLQRLKHQLQAGKLTVKLFLRHPLHAKLYLAHRTDHITPIVGFLGSSNLTLSGLQYQGELNVDVTDSDATQKLQHWFDERWQDQFCLDITSDLADIIEESWAREELIKPYYVYLKMAYHLSQEARDGLSQYQAPHSLDY